MTPFFEYKVDSFGNKVHHIVWFIDARSIDFLLKLRTKYGLYGIGL